MKHILTRREIESLPAGRLMDTLVQEYVFGDKPSRWSNAEQKLVSCHWFEEHPRSCAEDDGGYCAASGLPRYSTDVARAFELTKAVALAEKTLMTRTSGSAFQATFGEQSLLGGWVTADTLPLAICRAALLAT